MLGDCQFPGMGSGLVIVVQLVRITSARALSARRRTLGPLLAKPLADQVGGLNDDPDDASEGQPFVHGPGPHRSRRERLHGGCPDIVDDLRGLTHCPLAPKAMGFRHCRIEGPMPLASLLMVDFDSLKSTAWPADVGWLGCPCGWARSGRE